LQIGLRKGRYRTLPYVSLQGESCKKDEAPFVPRHFNILGFAAAHLNNQGGGVVPSPNSAHDEFEMANFDGKRATKPPREYDSLMKHGTLPTGEQFGGLSHVDTEIESLARETRMPRDLVARLYTNARAQLERTARVKTYVPVLIHRQVKALLKEHHRA
jgi:Protein of unknown function (DUF3562)